MYTKRLQFKIEDWMEEYLDKVIELHEHTEPEICRLIMAVGMGTLEAYLLGFGADKFFKEVGVPTYKECPNCIEQIPGEEKFRLMSRIFFIARQRVEERMKTLRNK